MANYTAWHDAERQILNALDIAAEYRAMDVRLSGDGPRASGWWPCHAVDRDDASPSAAIYVGSDTRRGRWRDLGGTGHSLNLWEFATRFGRKGDWREARKFFAEKTGVKLPVSGEPRRPEDMLEFNGILYGVLTVWAELKGGFDLQAVLDNGGCNARYPKKAKDELSQYVVAFPGYNGPAWAEGDAAAWVIANQTGKNLTIFRGKGNKPTITKTASVGGFIGSLLGQYALRALAAAREPGGTPVEVVWKVEGLSDMLALHTAIALAGLRGKHVVISNSQGAMESVHPDWITLLTDQTVYVCQDADRPGQIGTGRWCATLAGKAKEVRAVILPYPVEEAHGKDIRDYLGEGHDYQAMLDLAATAMPVTTDEPAVLSQPVRLLTTESLATKPGLVQEPGQPDYNKLMHLIGAEGIRAHFRSKFSAQLGVSVRALGSLRAGYYPEVSKAVFAGARISDVDAAGGEYVAFQVSDAAGNAVGIHMEPIIGTNSVTIGGPGLITPHRWDDYGSTVVVTRSLRDVMSLLTVDICAIALTGDASNIPMLVTCLPRRDINDHERAIIVVGERDWAPRTAQTLRDAGFDLTWWNHPPKGYASCHAWVRAQLPGVASAEGLVDLGNRLAGWLEGTAADPDGQPNATPPAPEQDWDLEDSLGAPPDLPPDPAQCPAPIIGAAAQALLAPPPPYWRYLSDTARERGIIDEREIDAARLATMAAESGDHEDVARWIENGKRISLMVDEETVFPRLAANQTSVYADLRPNEPLDYLIENGKICQRLLAAGGILLTEPLCNFAARITEEVSHDDGAETTTYFHIIGMLPDGTPLPQIDVRADAYADMDWVTAQWGARPIIHVGRSTKDHLRAAIQYLSGVVPRTTVYGHTGWRQIAGRWHYLHAAGALCSTGPFPGIAVRLPTALDHYRLPAPPGDLELMHAIQASLGMLSDLASDRIVFPVYAGIWRAVLGQADLSLALNGLTGTFKSEKASLAQRHFGSAMDRTHLPANWASTGNALEALCHAAKDTLLVVDDFCPPAGSTDAARYHAKADQVMRGAGNGAGRQRMRADTTLRPDRPPRCLILSTGEESPRGQSLQARMLQNDVQAGDINVTRLTACQLDAAAGFYAQALAGFVRWLAPQYATVQDSFRDEVADLRALSFRKGQHRRTPAIVAELTVALAWFLRYAYQIGAVSSGKVKEYLARCDEAFDVAAGKQTDDQRAEETTLKFLRLLAAALASGRAHVAAPDGREPTNGPITSDDDSQAIAGAWGWRRRNVGGGQYQHDEWQPQGLRVGWLDGNNLYLEPEVSFAVAQELARDQGDGLAISARTLRKRLVEKGLVIAHEAKRGSTTRKALDGVPDRAVLHLRADVLVKGADVAERSPCRDLDDAVSPEGLDLS